MITLNNKFRALLEVFRRKRLEGEMSETEFHDAVEMLMNLQFEEDTHENA